MSEETRSRILAAARQTFAERGFAGATTRTIAGEASVNIATLAYHFRDKQGLYDAVLDRIYERLLGVEIPDLTGLDRAERARVIVKAAWRWARDNREDIRLLLRHVMDHRTLPARASEKWTAALQQRGYALIAALDVPMPDNPGLVLLTLNHLVARYAITEPDELAWLVGSADPDDLVGDHIADVAIRLLGL